MAPTTGDKLVTRRKRVDYSLDQRTAKGDSGGSIRAFKDGKPQSNNGGKAHGDLKIRDVCNQQEQKEGIFDMILADFMQTHGADRRGQFILVGRPHKRFPELMTACRPLVSPSGAGICLTLCRTVMVHRLLSDRYSSSWCVALDLSISKPRASVTQLRCVQANGWCLQEYML